VEKEELKSHEHYESTNCFSGRGQTRIAPQESSLDLTVTPLSGWGSPGIDHCPKLEAVT